jgi:hypothetical protein
VELPGRNGLLARAVEDIGLIEDGREDVDRSTEGQDVENGPSDAVQRRTRQPLAMDASNRLPLHGACRLPLGIVLVDGRNGARCNRLANVVPEERALRP